jgi:hypothetical protein
MSRPPRNEQAAEDQRLDAAEHAVCEHPSEDRREIDERRVGAEDRRCERLAFETAVDMGLQPLEADDVLHPAWHQQVIDHV